jgi:ADP-heptose:LPS heptosyltransferase/GT2 family glycosyltransferase
VVAETPAPGGPFPDPFILIEIEAPISGGYVHNRLDLLIRGRTISTTPIKAVRLQVDDLVTSAAAYGQPERAAAAVLPDGRSATQRAFQFNLPRLGDGRPERCRFQIIAQTEDGFEHAQAFEVELDASAPDPISLVAGPTLASAVPGRARPYAAVYIEYGTIDGDGILSVKGWAVALAPMEAVQIFAGEQYIGDATTGAERGDVATVFPGYPNARLSGFSLTLPLNEANQHTETVCARVVCPFGFAQQETIPVERLQRRTLPPPAPKVVPRPPDPAPPSAEIQFFCDDVTLAGDGLLSINGWAVSGVGIAQVRVLLDDRDVGLASFGHERLDVAGIFPDLAMASLSGFRFEQKVGSSFHGEHSVRVIVRNLRNNAEERQVAVTVDPATLPTPVVPPPVPASELTPEQAAEFRFELDAPALFNNAAIETVSGRLTIDGWLLTRTGVASFDVFLDDQRLGSAHHGLARQDVGAAFPDNPSALRSGYAFHCPPRSLRDGDHRVEIRIRANSGLELVRGFSITVKKADGQNETTSIRRRMPRVEADMMLGFLADLECHPSFRLILRQDDSIDPARLTTTFNALRLQPYAGWTMLILAADDGAAATIRYIIDDLLPDLTDRFSILTPSDAAWATALVCPSLTWPALTGTPLAGAALAGPPLASAVDGRQTLHALLRPGDELGADALLEMAIAAGRQADREMIYGDEVRISPVSNEREPFFKPDFSPDLLLSANYIGRPWVATSALLARTGATPASLAVNGEYDLVLRCAELATAVHHIPKLLCQRAAAALDDPDQESAALEAMLHRRNIAGEVLPTPIPGTWRVKRTVAVKGKVSIIIPTCAAHGYIETCITSLRGRTTYSDFEIICIDNIPASEMAWKVWLQRKADKVVEIPDAFNWSVFNNRAAELATGEFLLFLNDDIEIIQGDWLDRLMEHAQRPEVGITGPQLLYRDGKVQHAGMFLSTNGIGRHAFRFAGKDDPCYFGLALTQRNVIAVTGACMLVRKDTFDRLGRFDEAHQIVNNDLDFCLKVHRAGLLTVFTPYASLIHYELASRAGLKDVFDLTHFNAAWKTTFAAGDPYFSPRLSRHADDYRPDDEPVQWVVAGGPMFHVAEIRRILVVKLDHIGDFVTALPPIRRLRKIFPDARITVLAGPASRAFIALEPSIDEFLPFAFFHARSQLGERELTPDDYAELAVQLRSYRFDLAVDLRKHTSTRDVLRYTGARFLAGFDYHGQFPFLDIALDWDGDRTLQRKRSHIVDELMRLVNAVGQATETDRAIMHPGPLALPLDALPTEVQALFRKPVVAIHPGAGNVTKQWPEPHFAALIDMLVEKNGVNIMLVGGPDEVEVADSLMRNVLYPHAVASMAGRTSLADLPRLLLNCVLYIGNDSGPKHIAAAVGIPTVGIHSGVVDPVEWGPVGPNAVALRRNMACSPCYLANVEDCPRSLACLRLFEPNMVYETADLLLQRSRLVTQPPTCIELAATDLVAAVLPTGEPVIAEAVAAESLTAEAIVALLVAAQPGAAEKWCPEPVVAVQVTDQPSIAEPPPPTDAAAGDTITAGPVFPKEAPAAVSAPPPKPLRKAKFRRRQPATEPV